MDERNMIKNGPSNFHNGSLSIGIAAEGWSRGGMDEAWLLPKGFELSTILLLCSLKLIFFFYRPQGEPIMGGLVKLHQVIID